MPGSVPKEVRSTILVNPSETQAAQGGQPEKHGGDCVNISEGDGSVMELCQKWNHFKSDNGAGEKSRNIVKKEEAAYFLSIGPIPQLGEMIEHGKHKAYIQTGCH